MSATRFLLACGLCFALSGCGRLYEATMSPDEKVSAAFPVSTDVRVARERLSALLADDVEATKALEADTATRMTVRALDCSKGLSIGRFDSVASVKALPVDRDCLQERDQALLQFYALRTIGVLVAKPPLRPRKTLGPLTILPRGKLKYISYGTVARDANVAVLRDGINNAAVVEIPGGRPIATLPRAMVSEPNNYLSPNGRVIAISPLAQSTTFYDTESGTRIWDSPDEMRVLAWLPSLGSFVYVAREGDVMIADGHIGTVSVHPVAAHNSGFGAHLPDGHERALIGTARDLSLVEHQRTAHGIRATKIKDFHLEPVSGITSSQPVPMRSGRRVVFRSMRDIGWLDLDTGRSGTWPTGTLRTLNFAKLDETHVLISTSELDAVTTHFWSLDINAGTIAPIDFGGYRGLIVDTGDRVGFMLRGNDAWIGDKVSAGEPIPLNQITRNFELEVESAMAAAERGEAAVNAADLAIEQVTGPARTAPAPRTEIVPGLGGVPQDAVIHIVGVYQGTQIAGSAGVAGHPMRTVRVRTRPSSHPIVLVLASYEPVNWVVSSSGAQVVGVMLGGYYTSTVVGIGDARVLRIGRSYAYKVDSDEYAALRATVAMYAGNRPVRSFQGNYTGDEFTVGGN